MNRIVVDTHALLGSLLGGEARLVMEEWWEGRAELVLSDEIVAEYLAALARLGASKEGARELMEAFAGRARGLRGKVVWVQTRQEPGEETPSQDPGGSEDSSAARRAELRPAVRKFIEAAQAGAAGAVVALDPELVERGGWKGIPILTPGAWLQARSQRRAERHPPRQCSRRSQAAAGTGEQPASGAA